MNILIQGARVIDPVSGLDQQGDVVVAQGRIQSLPGSSGRVDFKADKVIDASGSWVLPGLVDLCARLGEPGGEHANLLHSELAAAGAGGISSVVCAPDTSPVLDEPGLVEMLKFRAEKESAARVFPLGALTRGLKGESLTAMVALAQAGCVAFGQAEHPVMNLPVLQRAMQYAATHGFAVWLQPSDPWFGRGSMGSGAYATRMGLSSVPVMSETIALNTLFDLMRATGGKEGVRLHLQRVSSAAGVALIRAAKQEGLPITADVSIHSLFLVDTDVGYFDARMHVHPPLRQRADRDALRKALQEGVIDAIVSDHTPVSEEGKNLPFAQSEVGASALELLLNLTLQLAQEEGIAVPQALAWITKNPAQVLGKDLGCLRIGGQADVCVFDPQHVWRVDRTTLRSQGKHTPFMGRELQGKTLATVSNGHITYLRP